MLDCLLSCLGGQVNHEIDIEIPANCVDTDNVCDTDVPHVPGAKSCIGDFSTSNFNNYLYTQNSGSGPAYANMCVKVKQPDGKTPLQLVGDGQYHTYRFDWHTGSGTTTPGRVDFYFDDQYLGTNNAYVTANGWSWYYCAARPGTTVLLYCSSWYPHFSTRHQYPNIPLMLLCSLPGMCPRAAAGCILPTGTRRAKTTL